MHHWLRLDGHHKVGYLIDIHLYNIFKVFSTEVTVKNDI